MARLNHGNQHNIKLFNLFNLFLLIGFGFINDLVYTIETNETTETFDATITKLMPTSDYHYDDDSYSDFDEFLTDQSPEIDDYEEDLIDSSIFSGPGGIIPDYVPEGDDESPQMISRVIGGRPAENGSFPYIVSLRHGFGHICGGAILSPTWILTAAHCVKVEDVKSYRIQPNYNNQKNQKDEENVTLYEVSKIFVPYRRNIYADDLALIKLTEPIPLGDQIFSIRLPSTPSAKHIGEKVTVAGWGQMGQRVASTLMTADFPLISQPDCKKTFAKFFLDGMICAGIKGVDACPGDSGGPLVIRGSTFKEDVLIGVVSWGPPCGTAYGVYADIWHYRNWLEFTTDLDDPDNPNKFPWSNWTGDEKIIKEQPSSDNTNNNKWTFKTWNPISKTLSRIFDRKPSNDNEDKVQDYTENQH